MIRFNCQSCQMALSAPADRAGVKTLCPQCRQPVLIPPIPTEDVVAVAEVAPSDPVPPAPTEKVWRKALPELWRVPGATVRHASGQLGKLVAALRRRQQPTGEAIFQPVPREDRLRVAAGYGVVVLSLLVCCAGISAPRAAVFPYASAAGNTVRRSFDYQIVTRARIRNSFSPRDRPSADQSAGRRRPRKSPSSPWTRKATPGRSTMLFSCRTGSGRSPFRSTRLCASGTCRAATR